VGGGEGSLRRRRRSTPAAAVAVAAEIRQLHLQLYLQFCMLSWQGDANNDTLYSALVSGTFIYLRVLSSSQKAKLNVRSQILFSVKMTINGSIECDHNKR
jgi:hypothetical protein